jgi:hypothetical protein
MPSNVSTDPACWQIADLTIYRRYHIKSTGNESDLSQSEKVMLQVDVKA